MKSAMRVKVLRFLKHILKFNVLEEFYYNSLLLSSHSFKGNKSSKLGKHNNLSFQENLKLFFPLSE